MGVASRASTGERCVDPVIRDRLVGINLGTSINECHRNISTTYNDIITLAREHGDEVNSVRFAGNAIHGNYSCSHGEKNLVTVSVQHSLSGWLSIDMVKTLRAASLMTRRRYLLPDITLVTAKGTAGPPWKRPRPLTVVESETGTMPVLSYAGSIDTVVFCHQSPSHNS